MTLLQLALLSFHSLFLNNGRAGERRFQPSDNWSWNALDPVATCSVMVFLREMTSRHFNRIVFLCCIHGFVYRLTVVQATIEHSSVCSEVTVRDCWTRHTSPTVARNAGRLNEFQERHFRQARTMAVKRLTA